VIPDFVLDASRELAKQLCEDITLSRTREEHIRVTARANSAAALYNSLLNGELTDS